MKIDGRPLRKTRRESLRKHLPIVLQGVLDLDVDLNLLGSAELEDLRFDPEQLSFPPVTRVFVNGVDVAFLSVAGQSVLKEPSGFALYKSYQAYITGKLSKPHFVSSESPEAPDDLFFLDCFDDGVNQLVYRAICFVTYLSCRFGVGVVHEVGSFYIECKGRRFGIENGRVLADPLSQKIDSTVLSFALKSRRKWPDRTPSLDYLAKVLTVIQRSQLTTAAEISDDLCLLFLLAERIERGVFLSLVSEFLQSGSLFKQDAPSKSKAGRFLAADATSFALSDLRTIVQEIQWGATSSAYWTQLPARLRSAGLNERTARRVYFRKLGASSSSRPRPSLIVSKLTEIIEELEST